MAEIAGDLAVSGEVPRSLAQIAQVAQFSPLIRTEGFQGRIISYK